MSEDINNENLNGGTENSAASYENVRETETGSAKRSDTAVSFAELDGILSDASEKPRKKPAALIAVICVLVIVSIASVLAFMSSRTNKYNKLGYINISGRTLSDVAEAAGMSVDEFKKEYDLPEDMKEDTDEAAAYYSIPASKIAEMNGLESLDQLKEILGLQGRDDITDSTPWGVVEGETTLRYYVLEENVEAFKEFYGLGDNVTADTKWKDVRNTVDQKSLEERLQSEKENEEQSGDAKDSGSNDAGEGSTGSGAGESSGNSGSSE